MTVSFLPSCPICLQARLLMPWSSQRTSPSEESSAVSCAREKVFKHLSLNEAGRQNRMRLFLSNWLSSMWGIPELGLVPSVKLGVTESASTVQIQLEMADASFSQLSNHIEEAQMAEPEDVEVPVASACGRGRGRGVDLLLHPYLEAPAPVAAGRGRWAQAAN